MYVAEDDRLAEFVPESWLKVLSDLFVMQAPEFVMFGATPLGEALAPRLAQRFGAGLIDHALMIKVDDFDRCFIGRQAAYGGEYYEVLTTAGARSHFATVLPDTFSAPYPDASRYGKVETVEVNLEAVEGEDQNDRAGRVRLPQSKLKIYKTDVACRSGAGQIDDIDAAEVAGGTMEPSSRPGRVDSLDELRRRGAGDRRYRRTGRAPICTWRSASTSNTMRTSA